MDASGKREHFNFKQTEDVLDRIAVNSAERDRLSLQLKISLAIRDIWPDAFESPTHGPSRATWSCPAMTAYNWDRFERGMIDITEGFIYRVNDGTKFKIDAHTFRKLHNLQKALHQMRITP